MLWCSIYANFIAILRCHLKIIFKLLSQNSSGPSICPHKTIVSYWNRLQDFLKIYRENLSLKSNKNNGYFTKRLLHIFYHISLTSSENVKCFRQKLYRKSKHILYSIIFFAKSCRLWDNVKNIVERFRPQTTKWRKRIACSITKAIHTLRLCNTHCFCTATIVATTRLNVTLYVQCFSCYYFVSDEIYSANVIRGRKYIEISMTI